MVILQIGRQQQQEMGMCLFFHFIVFLLICLLLLTVLTDIELRSGFAELKVISHFTVVISISQIP